jgi:hypothetical protein
MTAIVPSFDLDVIFIFLPSGHERTSDAVAIEETEDERIGMNERESVCVCCCISRRNGI